MGNFIEGTFRAHGTKDSIRKFILGAFEPVSDGDKLHPEIIELDNGFYIDGSVRVYLKGTKKQYVEFDSIVVFNGKPDKEDSDWYMFSCNYTGEWEIDYEGMVRLAREYCVGIRANGYDCNTMKEELLEVNSNGEVTKYHIETYRNTRDWVWYCPMPNLGG